MTIFEKTKGKQIELKYEETGYHFIMKYLTEKELKWVAQFEVSEGEASEGVENYYAYQISENVYNINWVEEEGLTVSQILDFNTFSVYAFLTWNDEAKRGNREALLQKGIFKIINE